MPRVRSQRICANPLCAKLFSPHPANVAQGRGLYCSRPCGYACKRSQAEAERFWRKVLVCIHGLDCIYCCWEWQGLLDRNGYPKFHCKRDGRWGQIPAQQLGWSLLNDQPFPEGMMGLHHCDNPPCVNGMHIYSGTHRDNILDAYKRGQWIPPQIGVYGEKTGHAKLKDADIPRIRTMRAQGMTLKAIGLMFGVHLSTIHLIVHGHHGTHVP